VLSNNGPAARKRSGPGTGKRGSDALDTLRLDEEADVSASYAPIDGNPGFYRHGRSVAFRYHDGRGRRRWASGENLRAAKALKAALETDVRRGEHRERRESPFFAAYAREWIGLFTGRTSKGISEDSLDNYRKRLEADAIPFFGEMRLSEIEPRDVKAYATWLAKRPRRSKRKKPDLRPLSANTVRLGIAPVRALLATAFEEGLIRSNPAAGLRLFVAAPKLVVELDDAEDVEEVKALAEDELARLLAATPTYWLLFFTFLAQSALRIGEAIELRWRDVELGEGWLHARRRFYRGKVALPKGRKKRKIRLTPGMARELWRLRKETAAGEDELVFRAPRGGRIIPSNLMREVLKKAGRESGVGEWVGFHTFRHTCATMLFRGGWNAVQVQKFLGHSDPGFTLRRYVHLLPEDLPEPLFLEALTAVEPPPTQAETDGDGRILVASAAGRFQAGNA
jgi:integrase